MRVGALDHNGITEGSIWKPLLGFFFPIWMGTFFQQFYNTADAMIVGRFLGTSALAAVGATSSIVSLLVGFFVGLASGASVVIAQYYGARDRERLSASVHTAVILALVSGLFFMILGIGTARTILRIMQTPQDIMDDAMAYIRVYYMGMIPLMLYDMGTSILRALGDSRRPLYFLIASAIANILLDLLFVAVIPMGVTGAALATVLSEVLACVLTLMCLVKADGEPWQLRLKELRVSPMQLREMLRRRLPHRYEVAVCGQLPRPHQVCLLQCRRGRPGRIYGPLRAGGRSPFRAGGYDHCRLCHRRNPGLYLCPRRVSHCGSAPPDRAEAVP